MPRLIDADDLIKYFKDTYCENCKEEGYDPDNLICYKCCHSGAFDFISDVDDFADNHSIESIIIPEQRRYLR